MTRAEPTRQERFAAEVIKRAGGWDCTYGDADSGGAIDWWLEQDGVRVGGVEVTTVGDPRLFEAMSKAGDVYWDLPEARWAWMLSYSGRTHMGDVRLHLRDLVVLCEREDVIRPEELRRELRGEACIQWYRRSGSSLFGFRDSGRHGVVDVVPEGGGGFVFEDPTCIVDWVEQKLVGDLGRKVRRFDEIDLPERHLFLVVHDSGMPMSHYHPLSFADGVPDRAPSLPMGLTGLWMLPNWGASVLWWHENRGWTRTRYSGAASSASETRA